MIDLRYFLRVLFFGVATLGSATLLTTSVAALFSAMRPRVTVFNVQAQTERLDTSITTVVPFQWPLEHVEVTEGTGEPLILSESRSFSGSLRVEPPTKVQIERVALGPVTIDVENTRGGSVGQWYEGDEPRRPAGRVVRIVVRNLEQRAADGGRLLLTLAGDVTVGRPIGNETGGTMSLLRGGQLTMLASPIFAGAMFQEDTDDLRAGDHFSVRSAGSRASTDALGFIIADERPALTAVYRVEGLEGQIIRPGGGQIVIAASLLNRLKHDTLLQGLVQVLIFVAGLATLISSLLQGLQAWREARTLRPVAVQARANGRD